MTCVVEIVIIAKKQLSFSPKQYMLEGGPITSKLKNIEGIKKACNKILKSALKIASPNNGMAVAAKTKNLEVDKAIGNILKSIWGG